MNKENDDKFGDFSNTSDHLETEETGNSFENDSASMSSPENATESMSFFRKSETRIERNIGESRGSGFYHRPKRHLRSRQKGSFMKMLPNAITLTAFCFGLTAIRFALFHKWEVAVACVLIAAFLDSLDGRVARVIGHSSQFGAELDSLSDLVCFGVAPAMLIFLNGLYMMEGFGWGICIFLAMCCAMRLARFNAVLIMNEPQPAWAKKYFTGVPAPAGAAITLFPMILFFATGNPVFLSPFFVITCAVFSGIMMISRVKSFSSKMIEFKDGFASPELVAIGLIIICMMTAPWVTLSCLIGVYIALIPFGAYYYKRHKESAASGPTADSDFQEFGEINEENGSISAKEDSDSYLRNGDYIEENEEIDDDLSAENAEKAPFDDDLENNKKR